MRFDIRLLILGAAGLLTILLLQSAHAADFSGQYAGTMTLSQGNRCGTPVADRSGTVSGDKIEIVYNQQRNTVVKGTVAPDGTFSAEADQSGGTIRAHGKIANNEITGTIGGASCAYDLKLMKEP